VCVPATQCPTGRVCGYFDDGCQGKIPCGPPALGGNCQNGYTCNADGTQCVPDVPTTPCTPKTQCSAGKQCGEVRMDEEERRGGEGRGRGEEGDVGPRARGGVEGVFHDIHQNAK
jgi:hypothetical protein